MLLVCISSRIYNVGSLWRQADNEGTAALVSLRVEYKDEVDRRRATSYLSNAL